MKNFLFYAFAVQLLLLLPLQAQTQQPCYGNYKSCMDGHGCHYSNKEVNDTCLAQGCDASYDQCNPKCKAARETCNSKCHRARLCLLNCQTAYIQCRSKN